MKSALHFLRWEREYLLYFFFGVTTFRNEIQRQILFKPFWTAAALQCFCQLFQWHQHVQYVHNHAMMLHCQGTVNVFGWQACCDTQRLLPSDTCSHCGSGQELIGVAKLGESCPMSLDAPMWKNMKIKEKRWKEMKRDEKRWKEAESAESVRRIWQIAMCSTRTV